MPLQGIAYTSIARDGLGPLDLDRLLADATAFNRVAGVTGVLMFDGHRFLQYIEGPGDGIASVFPRIENATGHLELLVLARGGLDRRHFPRWSMAAQQLEPTTSSLITDAHWDGFGPASVGFALMLGAWTGRHGELEPPAVMLGS